MTNSSTMNPDQWLEEHGDFLFRYARVRVRDMSVAEDMVQETFLAALKSMSRFEPGQSERAWLVGILRHKIVDYYRKSSREIPVENTEFADIENSSVFKAFGIPAVSPPRWKFSPRKALEQKEFMDAYAKCVSRLEGRMHAAYTLKELEEEETGDVCKELGITPNHLWVLVHRARAQLKLCLETNWLKHHEER
jgi:RNA polymerase sigma-70 factor (ECF subfamily)